MMNFAHFKMLYLVWTLPVLLLIMIHGARRRGKILKAFAGDRALARIVPPGLAGRRRLRAALVLGAMLLLAIAVSGPRYGFQWQQIERRGVDIMIALDCSRSMLAQDIQPTRLDRAKREIYDLLGMLQGDRAGLVAFSGSAFLQCPLTVDYDAFNLFLSVLTPDYLPVGGSDLSAAVHAALEGFEENSPVEKALILITDGENTGRGDPMDAARAAQKAGLRIFCIGVGSGQGVPVPDNQGGFKKDADGQIVLSNLDEALLTRMARATGGAYVRSVAGDMDLDAVYRDRIRTDMQAATVESGRKQVWADRFQWPLALAVALLLAAGLIPSVKGAHLALLAIMLLPAFSEAHAGPLQEGYKFYQQGQYEKALEHFTKAQLEDPQNPEVLYNVGNAYYKNSNFAAAAQHYAQALEQADPQLKAKLLYNLGNSAYRQGRLKEAVENYEASLQLDPKDSQARENLEFVRKKMQNQQQQQDDSSDPKKDNQQKPDQQGQQKQQQQPDQDKPDRKNTEPDQQKPDQQQADQQPSPQDAGDQQNSGQNQDPGQNQQQDRPPQYGSEMNPGQAGQPEGQKPPEQQTPAGSDGDRKEEVGQNFPSGRAQMLNRLKDQPGRAMMPNYRKQAVEKDW